MLGAGCDRFGAQGVNSAGTCSGIRGWRVVAPEAKRHTRPPGKEDERKARRRSRELRRGRFASLTPPAGCQRKTQPECFSDRLLARVIHGGRSESAEVAAMVGDNPLRGPGAA
jgi:hypothetical protein